MEKKETDRRFSGNPKTGEVFGEPENRNPRKDSPVGELLWTSFGFGWMRKNLLGIPD
jgi:hypothetical protein